MTSVIAANVSAQMATCRLMKRLKLATTCMTPARPNKYGTNIIPWVSMSWTCVSQSINFMMPGRKKYKANNIRPEWAATFFMFIVIIHSADCHDTSRCWFMMLVMRVPYSGRWCAVRGAMSEACCCLLTVLKMAILRTLAVTRAPLRTVYHVDLQWGETLN